MAYAKISALDASKKNWAIQGRLCRVWEAINFKNGNEVMGLEMVFVDDEGDSIQGFIRKVHMRKYRPMLEEGQVYAIKGFKVGTEAPRYQVFPNKSRMYFDASTSVHQLPTASHRMPQNVFFFTTADTHEQRIGNNTLLTDIFGCVSGVGKDLNVPTGTKKRIELATADEKILKVTLWGNVSEMFDYSSYDATETPVIAIITSTTLTKFKGEISFSSTTATKIYFNLDIAEVRELTLRFAEAPPAIRVLEDEEAVAIPLAEQMVLNRRTIGQLLEMEWISDNQVYTFTIMAKIVEIKHQYGWCYISCNQCTKKLVPDNGTFLCTTCNKQCSYPIIRYKIHVHVMDDERGSTTLVIFTQEAEKLLNKAASTYADRLGVGNNDIPQDINKLTGKTFVFKIKVTDYNLKDGFQNYTVLKIFTPNTNVDGTEVGPLKTQEAGVDGKRKGSLVVSDESKGIGAPSSGSDSSIHPVTPAKKNQAVGKKLKCAG